MLEIKRAVCLVAMLLVITLLLITSYFAHAQTHEVAGESNAIQHMVLHADVTITGAAAAVDICGGTNANRVTARVSNTGATNNMRVGPSTATDNTHGMIIAQSTTGVALDTTDPIYVYSQSGTTANCLEITR